MVNPRVVATSLLVSGLLASVGSAQPCSHHVPPAVDDSPDAAFTDANGDGIDGMRCGPIFVDVLTGSDQNPGTIVQPKRTIGAAIAAAKSFSPVRSVYVSKGAYNEVVTLLAGVDVHGGYDAANGWARSAANQTSIIAGPTAVFATSLGVPTTLSHLTIDSSSASGGTTFNAAVVAFLQSLPEIAGR